MNAPLSLREAVGLVLSMLEAPADKPEPSEDDLEGPDEGPAYQYSDDELRAFEVERDRMDEFNEDAWGMENE